MLLCQSLACDNFFSLSLFLTHSPHSDFEWCLCVCTMWVHQFVKVFHFDFICAKILNIAKLHLEIVPWHHTEWVCKCFGCGILCRLLTAGDANETWKLHIGCAISVLPYATLCPVCDWCICGCQWAFVCVRAVSVQHHIFHCADYILSLVNFSIGRSREAAASTKYIYSLINALRIIVFAHLTISLKVHAKL